MLLLCCCRPDSVSGGQPEGLEWQRGVPAAPHRQICWSLFRGWQQPEVQQLPAVPFAGGTEFSLTMYPKLSLGLERAGQSPRLRIYCPRPATAAE